jgi:hypothetical protein
MSTRRLRARVDRLLRSANFPTRENKKRSFEFNIDPAVANPLRDDFKRLDELERARPDYLFLTKGPDTEEERMLRSRIAERASKIRCPAGYGLNEAWDDRVLLLAAEHSEDLPPWFGDLTPLSDAEDPDAEKAQAIARIEAFNQTPEGRARARIAELNGPGWKSPAEQMELDGLLTLYPEPHIHPKDPMRGAAETWRRAARSTAEEDRRLFERANLLRRRAD